MKVFLTVLVAALLGAAAGVAVSAWRLSGGLEAGDELPAVVVDNLAHDFGRLNVDTEGEHAFTFTNQGQAALQLSAGPTSCDCTLSEIKRNEIPPGESGKVIVKWSADKVEELYRQTAVIKTNDPNHPRVTLTVAGRIIDAIEALPPRVVFSGLTTNESLTAEVALFCTVEQPLRITGVEFERPDTAEFFEVSDVPLPEAQLRRRPDVHHGRLVRIIAKAGMPPGAIRQTVILQTNLDASPTVELPIDGAVAAVRDISILGPRGWDEDSGVLDFAEAAGSAPGDARRLTLIVRGPYRDRVKFTLEKVAPEGLEVEIGKTTVQVGGRTSSTPLLIRLRDAAGGPAADSQLGEIVIATGLPQTPELRLRVRFAKD